MEQAKKTATYRVVTDSGGDRIFRFYCDISGELCCVTRPIQADTEEAALEMAWEQEGKWEFNLCPKCGKYVSSAMFNVNAGLCLDCAPWETEFPAFCHQCGASCRIAGCISSVRTATRKSCPRWKRRRSWGSSTAAVWET